MVWPRRAAGLGGVLLRDPHHRRHQQPPDLTGQAGPPRPDIPLAHPTPVRVSFPVMSAAAIPATPTERFAGIIDGLCRAVAARGGGRDRLAGPLVILIWSRLRRIAAQIIALAARIEAGRHRCYPARRPPRRPAAPRRHVRPALPHGFAWLLPLVPWAAAGYGSQLRHLLAEPEFAALVDAAPQMRRLLRPLCRMLAVPLPRPRAAEPAPPPPAHPAPAASAIATPSPPPAPASPPPAGHAPPPSVPARAGSGPPAPRPSPRPPPRG